jgi:uncharacterized membrane protein (UPF0127 family)
MRRRSIVFLVLALLLLPEAPAIATPANPIWRDSSPWSTERARVTVGDQVISAEVADTSPLQVRGLSYRDGLLPGTGMLFKFEQSSVRSFWMRGMRFCLDIIWIEAGRITGAAQSVCPMPGVPESDLPRYSSKVPVSYVLEVPAGWMAEHGFAAGEPVQIELPPSAVG